MENISWRLDEKYSMEYIEKFQKAAIRIKGNFLHFLSNRDGLLELFELLYRESFKDEEDIFNLTQELLTTQDSLKSTQCALQESKMEVEQLHEKLQKSYLPSYTPFNHIHKAD